MIEAARLAEALAGFRGRAQPALMAGLSLQRWLVFRHRAFTVALTRIPEINDAIARGDVDGPTIINAGAPISVTLIQPVAMDEGLRFAIREGGRTVGAGQVTKIVK